MKLEYKSDEGRKIATEWSQNTKHLRPQEVDYVNYSEIQRNIVRLYLDYIYTFQWNDSVLVDTFQAFFTQLR